MGPGRVVAKGSISMRTTPSKDLMASSGTSNSANSETGILFRQGFSRMLLGVELPLVSSILISTPSVCTQKKRHTEKSEPGGLGG